MGDSALDDSDYEEVNFENPEVNREEDDYFSRIVFQGREKQIMQERRFEILTLLGKILLLLIQPRSTLIRM